MANEAITVTESESPGPSPPRKHEPESESESRTCCLRRPDSRAMARRPGHYDPSRHRHRRLWQPMRQPGGGPAPSQAQCGPVESTEWTRKATDRRSRHGHSAWLGVAGLTVTATGRRCGHDHSSDGGGGVSYNWLGVSQSCPSHGSASYHGGKLELEAFAVALIIMMMTIIMKIKLPKFERNLGSIVSRSD